MTREQWLEQLRDFLAAVCEESGKGQPEVWRDVRVSCGYGVNKVRSRTFDVVPGTAVEDGRGQIFIAPHVSLTRDAVGAFACGITALVSGAHKINVRAWRAAYRDIEPFLESVAATAEAAFGPYPQPKIGSEETKDKNEGESRSGLSKVWCGCSGKEYILRATRKTIERAVPLCPFCREAMKTENIRKES
jgi:hypothetical protein